MEKSKKNAKGHQDEAPRSGDVAKSGITTGADFANLMSALMSDLIEGRVSPNIGNATCKAASQLLRVVELQMKYGTEGKNGKRVLQLAMSQPLANQELAQ